MCSAEFWLVQNCFVAKGMSMLDQFHERGLETHKTLLSQNNNISSNQKQFVLSIKDKPIIISRLDEGGKGTNLRAWIWHQQATNLQYTQEQGQDPEIHWQHRDMQRVEAKVAEACRWWVVWPGLVHLVYSAKVNWITNFRPASSGESETFPFVEMESQLIVKVSSSWSEKSKITMA